MPMFDFECSQCHQHFEELVFDEDNPPCPKCGCTTVYRLPSMPSPKPVNPFPYKVGPVNQNFVNKVHAAESGQAPSCGGSCSSCPHSSSESSD